MPLYEISAEALFYVVAVDEEDAEDVAEGAMRNRGYECGLQITETRKVMTLAEVQRDWQAAVPIGGREAIARLLSRWSEDEESDGEQQQLATPLPGQRGLPGIGYDVPGGSR